MQVPIASSAHVALIVSESEADRVPPEFETVHVPENRVRVRDLVEEELLLTLPISPLHEETEECGVSERAAGCACTRRRCPIRRDRLNSWASC